MPESFPDATSPAHQPWHIRPLASSDLDGLMQVQAACYGADFMESREVYRSRLACPAQCSLVAVRKNVVLAYLAAYVSTLGSVTPLHGEFAVYPQADTLYLHDMAVSPNAAGLGLATALFTKMWQNARAWSPRFSALVSVQGSQNYWRRKGYDSHTDLSPANRKTLEGYGDDADYMVRPYIHS